jgi:hypothetical protein
MKKTLLILLILLLVFAAVPITAQGADSDFDVTYDLAFSSLPYKGGTMRITINVYNNGSSNITWVDAIVNLASPYYMDRWSGTITPGGHESINMYVPFKQTDLDKDVWLQVSMNNDIDTNPDGVWMRKIRVNSNDMPVFDRTLEVSPGSGSVYTDSTVQVSMEYTNATGSRQVKKLMSWAQVTFPGGRALDIPYEFHPDLIPTDTSVHTFDIPIRRNEVGLITVRTYYSYAVDGYSYDITGEEFTIMVRPIIELTATLSAAPLTIDIGDEVNFSLTVENHGDSMEELNIFLPERIELGALDSGDSVTYEYTLDGITMTEEITIPLIAMSFTRTKRFDSNMVVISVNPRSDAPAEATAEPPESPMPEATAEPIESAAPADKSGEEPEDDEEKGDNKAAKSGLSVGMIILIAAAALILAGGIAASLIIMKKKGIIPGKGKGK